MLFSVFRFDPFTDALFLPLSLAPPLSPHPLATSFFLSLFFHLLLPLPCSLTAFASCLASTSCKFPSILVLNCGHKQGSDHASLSFPSYPETAGRSLEEIDIIFARGYVEKVSYVKMAQSMPALTSSDIAAEWARLGLQDIPEADAADAH